MFDLPDLGPLMVLALIGLIAIVLGAGWVILWLLQHVRFV